MNDLRKTTGQVRQALKAQVRRALHLAGGGDSVQFATRVKAPALSRYASSHEDNEAHHCPIDVALDLDFEAGQPLITGQMARAQGFELVPMVAAEHSDLPWVAKLGLIHRKAGERDGLIAEALADGQIDAEEARLIDVKIEDEISDLRRVQARIRAEGAAGGSIVRMTGEARR